MRPAMGLYTLRDHPEGPSAVLEALDASPVEGVEFAGLPAEETVETFRGTDLEAVGIHVDIERLEGDREAVTDVADRLDCGTLVVPYVAPEALADWSDVTALAQRLATLAAAYEDRRLCYHNHDHELGTVGERTVLEQLADQAGTLGVGFELDVGWIRAAGVDPADYVRTFPGDLPLVHLKDVDGGHPVSLGAGELDAEAVAAAARERDVEWLVYEHDSPTNPAAELDHGASAVATLCE